MHYITGICSCHLPAGPHAAGVGFPAPRRRVRLSAPGAQMNFDSFKWPLGGARAEVRRPPLQVSTPLRATAASSQSHSARERASRPFSASGCDHLAPPVLMHLDSDPRLNLDSVPRRARQPEPAVFV
ncbi:hypothetical protein C8Q78DRAFT_219659 [Trametes maxima]|nr:hypothetical protein C8Q78DRAFT_219659 [Trametes maxima]